MRGITLTNRTNQREYCCAKCGAIFIDVPDHNVTCPNIDCKENFYIFIANSLKWTIVKESVIEELKRTNKCLHYVKDHPKYEENF